MATSWSPVVFAALLAAPLPTQQPDATAAERLRRRTADDVAAACRQMLEQPLAFAGTCRFTPGDAAFPADDQPIPFRGAWHQGLALLQLRQHEVLTHGDRQLVARDGAGWTLPQGDAPDLPFSPRALASHLATATLGDAEPVFLDGRPAMRVHAVWNAQAAAALLHDSYHPQPQAQQILERLPGILQRQDPARVCVDAAICFDPATRTLRSAVLRAALLGADDLRAGDDSPPAPDGLPALTRERLLEYTFALTLLPLDEVPFPELDATLRERLAWAPSVPPATRPVR